jgi:phosphatidylglycerol lysyltransferase
MADGMSAPTVSGLGRLWRRLSPLVGLALFLVALWVLGRELRYMPPAKLAAALKQFPGSAIGLATLFTFLNYFILTGYDQLAFLYIRRPIARWQIAMASFVGYAIANNVGFALLSGTSARYRFYSRWGLSGREISQVVIFYSGTFWLGLLVLGGWTLATGPAMGLDRYVPLGIARATGWLLIATAAAYPIVALFRRAPVSIGGMPIPMPNIGLVIGQFVLSALDWTLAAAVLYVLLPAPRPDFVYFVGVFLASQLIALVSHVPGGLGVFESLMILVLAMPAEAVLPALAMFRVIYYLLPLGVALGVLTIDEFYQRRHAVGQWGNAFGTLTMAVAPKLLAVFMMLGGAVLMFSGATPTAAGRLAWVNAFVPLPVIELSHFVGSVVGFGLLVVAWGLARRLDAAYVLGCIGLVVGIVASLLKGGDYEEALVLSALLVALFVSREEFDRKAALFEIPFSPAWVVSTLVVVAGSIGLGLFAFRHVEWSQELWWRFEVDQDAPRFLRATVGILIAMTFVGVRRLMRPAQPDVQAPGLAELDEAAPIVVHNARTTANLVFLGDKGLLWNDARTAFVMYGVQGRTWVALGDPVGPQDAAEPLVKAFLERCDDYQGVPVFYEASKQWLHVYADFGLTFAKLGEEARVFLPHFALEGSGHKKLRTSLHRLGRGQAAIRIVPPAGVPAMLPSLKEVSDAWLAEKATAEKGFSLGLFNPDYIGRFPTAVVEIGSRVEAFATLWPSTGKQEISLDLMRFRPSAPQGTMDALFAWLLSWARQEGYQWFNLGMAPLSGLEASPVSPLWSKLGRLVYGYGEAFYNFQGLRAYKEKFDPVWEPRYLAYPGGLALPRVVTDVSALIAGGYRRIFIKPSA